MRILDLLFRNMQPPADEDALRKLRGQVEDIESAQRRLKGEWEDTLERLSRLAGRVAKREQRALQLATADPAEEPASQEEVDDAAARYLKAIRGPRRMPGAGE